MPAERPRFEGQFYPIDPDIAVVLRLSEEQISDVRYSRAYEQGRHAYKQLPTSGVGNIEYINLGEGLHFHLAERVHNPDALLKQVELLWYASNTELVEQYQLPSSHLPDFPQRITGYINGVAMQALEAEDYKIAVHCWDLISQGEFTKNPTIMSFILKKIGDNLSDRVGVAEIIQKYREKRRRSAPIDEKTPIPPAIEGAFDEILNPDESTS